MKISIIGAGNVGSLTAMRIAQEGLGEVLLVDIAGGLARGKALDLEDARALVKSDYRVEGTSDIRETAGSSVVVITAGLTRKPGMSREELFAKNARIVKEVCEAVKAASPGSLVIVVTNPLDLMTRVAFEETGFDKSRVFGMGITLDAARFANLIAQELKVPCAEIDACVIGAHGEGMLPLTRLTTVRGVSLEEFLDEEKKKLLVRRTIERGAEIVSLLGSGSAYFAPSAAICALVRAIAKDEKRTFGVSVYLEGAYGIKGVCIGTPCRIGRRGIEEMIELKLNAEELKALRDSARRLNEQYEGLGA